MGERNVRGEGASPQQTIARLWADAAHDLRQPAQAALLVTRMLAVESTRSKQKFAAQNVAAALESLCEMLEVLALISRIEAGRVQASFEPVDLSALTKVASISGRSRR